MTGLSTRDTVIRELMDDPDCDTELLNRTYGDFRIVNRVVSGWRRIYRRHIRPVLSPSRPTTVLDIGSGGGDIPLALAHWAARDRLAIDITAIDPDPRAHEFATSRHEMRGEDRPGVTFRCASSAELVAEGARFDLVTSNHLLHHLPPTEFAQLLAESRQLARVRVIHNDIERSRFAYGAFWVATAPITTRSFVRTDGLRSIRRSYRQRELEVAASEATREPRGLWAVERQFPSRLLLTAPGSAA